MEPMLALSVFSGALLVAGDSAIYHLVPRLKDSASVHPFWWSLPSNSCKTGHEAFHLSPVMTLVAAAFIISHVGHHSDFLTSPLLHDRVAHLKWSLTVSLFCWKCLRCSPLWTGHSASSFCISFQDVIQPRGWSHLYWACHIQNTEPPSTGYLFLSPTFMSFLNVVLWLVCHLSCREN